MSTENMRKLMQLTEGLDDNRNDDYCRTCGGWGEILPPDVEQDMDNIVPCPDCGPEDGPARLKTKDIKDLSMEEAESEDWDVEDFPLSEGEGRPYICVHAKKGKHECHADSSYGAAKKAAEHWGLKSTAGIDAHLADIEHSTQFVGEEFPAQGSDQECAWWAGCHNDATTTEPHPVLGDVPICDRCVAKLRKIEGLDEANFFDIMKTNRSGDDDDEPYVPRDRHAERPHTPGYDKQSSGARAAADSRAKAFMFDEDDGDVPSRRVDDEELTGVLLKKVDSALKYIALGMKEASERGSRGPLNTKQKVIKLRRKLKEIKARLERGQKLTFVFGKVQSANEMADALGDLSEHFDNVLFDVHDIENLLYLHLNKRPVAIDESSCPCGKDGCECGPDCDCEPVEESGDNLDWGVGDYVIPAWEESGEWGTPLEVIGVRDDQVLVQDDFGNKEYMFPEDLRKAPVEEDRKKRERPEVKGVNDKYDDELKCKHCGDYFCTSKWGGECPEIQMDMFPEDISLESIAESVLQEYEGQPKDYEMSDEELEAEAEKEFERDNIDPEIEDEELGMRFD